MERRLAHLEIGFCLLVVVLAMMYWKLDSKIITIMTKLDELLQHKTLPAESLNA